MKFEGTGKDVGQTDQAETEISLVWLPCPAIKFHVKSMRVPVGCQTPQVRFQLADGTDVQGARGHSITVFPGGPMQFTGGIDGHVVRRFSRTQPTSNSLFPTSRSYVLLSHPDTAQSKRANHPRERSDRSKGFEPLAGDERCGWRLTLIPAERGIASALAQQSGFGITYRGRLERENGDLVNAEEAVAVLGAVAWYASFVGGRRTGPVLPGGINGSGARAWEIWVVPRVAAFQDVSSWFPCPSKHRKLLTEVFAGFMERWMGGWKELIPLAIHWYVEANGKAGSTEGSIVLTQTALSYWRLRSWWIPRRG